jgi:hypothetical protein
VLLGKNLSPGASHTRGANFFAALSAAYKIKITNSERRPTKIFAQDFFRIQNVRAKKFQHLI